MGSPQFWAQPFRIPVSSDPDTATAETVAVMCDHIRKGALDAGVQSAAMQAVNQFAGMADVGLGPGSVGAAAFWWCKHFLKFVHHEFIIRQRLGEAGHLQGLISPEVIVNQIANGERPAGDCAIYSDCVAAFLRVFGVPFEVVTVAVNPEEPTVFSHVFIYEVRPDGSRLPLDASHGEYPGWQVPTAHVSRRQVWDMNGNPVADRGSRFSGLGNYVLSGMGADGDFGGEYSGPDNSYVPLDPYLEPGGVSYDLGPGYFGGGNLTVPSKSSPQWADFASKALQGGMTLALINSMPAGSVINPNGQIVRQAPGYAVTPGTLFSSVTSGGINPLYIGLGLVGLFVILQMGKK